MISDISRSLKYIWVSNSYIYTLPLSPTIGHPYANHPIVLYWIYLWSRALSVLVSVDTNVTVRTALLEKCPCSEIFWFVFSLIQTEYEQILRISLYSVRMQENTDQKNSEYRHFSRSASFWHTKNNTICHLSE